MEYLHLFNTDAEFQDAYTNNYHEPWISYTKETDTIKYNKTEEEKYRELLATPLTFEVISGGIIYWKKQGSPTERTLQYKLNGGTLTNLAPNNSITVASGDVVQFFGTAATYGESSSDYHTFSDSTAKFDVEGNIMSLIDKDNYTSLNTLTSAYTFINLFRATNVKNAENLQLPATILAEGCYRLMFTHCSDLTTAPELPATTLDSECYRAMFQGCTSLTTPPELPATTLADYCYYCMFNLCTSLTTAPALPVTTLAESCYDQMFKSCSSLTTPPELPATTLASSCYRGMFAACRGLTTAPELQATTLATGCYYGMFQNCTNLNYIKCLATDISASNCLTGWVSNVSDSGTFVKDSAMNNWTSDANGIPANWTIQNA